MTVDKETKLNVVAKTKKIKRKTGSALEPYVAHALKLHPIVSLTKFTPVSSISPSIPIVRPNPNPKNQNPQCRWVFVYPLTNPRFTTRLKKEESFESRRGARPKRAWFFPSIQPSSRPSDATDATDAWEHRRRNPMHRKYIDRSIDADQRADQRAVRSRARALLRTRVRRHDRRTDGWTIRPSIHSVFFTNRPFVNRQISHGSGPQTDENIIIVIIIQLCVRVGTSIQPSNTTPRRRDATRIRRTYRCCFFLCTLNVRFRVT